MTKTNDTKKNHEKKPYTPKFIPTKENKEKLKEAFDKSREESVKGKFDDFVEV